MEEYKLNTTQQYNFKLNYNYEININEDFIKILKIIGYINNFLNENNVIQLLVHCSFTVCMNQSPTDGKTYQLPTSLLKQI